ncbi:hypothetical protein PQX77_006479 [Marasmius sp. AFHP31]|nr:hypothetical protein PQX77_006479 [Marasmius sp. AFHP31]
MPSRIKDASGRATFAIVKPAIIPRIRRRGVAGKDRPKRPPLTEEQKTKMRDARLEKKEKKEKAMTEWLTEIGTKAQSLGDDFGTDKHYWLLLLFQNGKRMIKIKSKPNAFNAYKSMKSRAGKGETLMEITENYTEEYNTLTEEEKAKYVEEFEDIRDQENLPLVSRPSGKAQAQDAAHVIANIEAMFESLRRRLGIDGFFLLVRNRVDGILDPYWYFSRPEIAEYMPLAVKPKWSLEEVGAKVESFCLVGCDTSKLYRTSPARAQALKAEIRALLTANLAEVSGRPNPKVHYEDINQMLTKKEGIVIENWPYSKFENLSKVSMALPGLFKLRDSVRSGHIHFRKMSREEHQRWLDEEDQGPKDRKIRSDAGKKRVRLDGSDADSDADGEENDAMVVDDEEEDELAPTSLKPKERSGKKGKSANEKPKGSEKQASTKSKSKSKSAANANEPLKKRQRGKASTITPLPTEEVNDEIPYPSAPSPTLVAVPSPSPFPVPDNPAPFNFAPPTSFAHILNNPTVWNLALCMAQGKIQTYPKLEGYLKAYLKDQYDEGELKPITDALFQDVENEIIEEDLRRLMATYLGGFAPPEMPVVVPSSSSFLTAPVAPPQEFLLPDPDSLVDDIEEVDDGVRRSRRAPKPKKVVHMFSEFHPNTRKKRD